ncbi:MAG: energy-coupling factor transporter transmembrane component T [Ectobacillus sp.]
MRSAFSHVHPAVAFGYYIGLIILGMTLLHPIILATSVLFLFLLNILQGNGAIMKKTIVASLLLGMMIAVINPLLTHRGSTILFYFLDNPITLEAVTYGYTMALSFFVIALAFVSYNQMITSHKFLYLFSRISPKMALLTMIAIRFVPLFIRRLRQIGLVQQTKGVDIGGGPLKYRVQSGMKLLSVLLVCSLEEALQTADSMQARGFGVKKRSTYIRYSMNYRDWAIAASLLVLFCVCAAGFINGGGVLVIYPALEAMAFDAKDWVAFVSFILYINVPLLLEGREWIWWHIQR